MRLTKLASYRELVYAPGEGPTLKTLRRRIAQIPGGRVEMGRYYVDLDVNDRVNQISRAVDERRQTLRNDPLLTGLV